MINKNELPKDWEVVRLGDFVRTEKGKKPKFVSNEKTYEFCVPYVNIKAFEQKIIDEYTNGVGCVFCEDNDFLMVWDGSRSGYVGKAIKGALGSTLVKLTFPDISNEYAFYFLKSKFIEINTRAKGVGIPHVDPNLVWNYDIPIPPLTEQEHIVAKIEELFSELDAGTESLKRAQRLLKIYRQAVLKWAFEGKLTNENVKEDQLPASWKWVKLEELAESVKNGYGKKPDDKGNFPILRISSVRPFKINLNDVRFLENPLDETNSIKENDLLFTRYNGSRDFVGVCARVPPLKEVIFYPDKLIRCRPIIKSEAHSVYLQYAVNMGVSRQFVLSKIKTTAGQTGISGQEVKSIPIPICSLEEQQRIVQEIESRLSVCDKLEETIGANLKQAEALRQSILKKAFEGKLVKPKAIEKPKRTPFYQMQTLGLIVNRSKQNHIRHGEMTLAKYAFLADKIYGVPLYERYERWHLGPYPTDIKKTVNNREYFKIENNQIRVLNEEKLFKYHNDYKEQIETAVDELTEIFSSFKPQDRSHKTELLATVCKVVEDVQTTDIEVVRQSMAEWKIDLKDKKFKDKAEKFSREETAKCLEFIKQKGWDKKLIK